MLELLNLNSEKTKELMNSAIILVDTREKKNNHIIGFFDEKGIQWDKKTLLSGDYSIMIPKNLEIGLPMDIDLSRYYSIERKANLEELSANLSFKRKQFEHELYRQPGRLSIIIEEGSYSDIARGNYGTQFNPNAYIASIHALEHQYGVTFKFVEKVAMGYYIHKDLTYFAKTVLRSGESTYRHRNIELTSDSTYKQI